MRHPSLALSRSAGFLLLVACAPEGLDPAWAPPPLPTHESTPPSDPGEEGASSGELESACGDVHYVDMTLTGVVLDAQFDPVPDASVWLEERNWSPHTVHGEGFTDEEGRFFFDIEAVPIVEECWGIGPQFYVSADDQGIVGEIPANMHIVWAWLDGTFEADITGLPCVID